MRRPFITINIHQHPIPVAVEDPRHRIPGSKSHHLAMKPGLLIDEFKNIDIRVVRVFVIAGSAPPNSSRHR